MKVELGKKEKNIVELLMEIPAKDAQQAYDQAAKKVAQHVNIAGFRKGKAPKHLVERHVGVDYIKQEALDRLIPSAIQKAIMEKELDVISQPVLEKYDFEVGKDVKLTVKIEVRPEIKLGKYKDLKLKAEGYEIPEDAFDVSLNNLLKQNSTLKVVSGRKVKGTDVVVFDFDGYSNGEPIESGKAEKYTLDLANSNFIPGYAEQLVGHEIGEEFDINVDFPKEYHDEKLAGQPAVFKIKIHEIKERVLPELNDEFAKKVGNFETVQDLKDDISNYLTNTKEEEEKKIAYSTIISEILDKTEMEVPDSMVQREVDALMQEYAQRLQMQGFTLEQAIESQGEDNIRNSLKDEAVNRIKNSLILDEIAKEENLKLEKEDLDEKFKSLENVYRMNRVDLMKQMAKNPDMLNMISQQALNDKVANFLRTVNEVTFTASKPAKKSEKKETSTKVEKVEVKEVKPKKTTTAKKKS